MPVISTYEPNAPLEEGIVMVDATLIGAVYRSVVVASRQSSGSDVD